MTIRDIAIAFGYEVDKASEKKANDSVSKLKSTATKLLGALGIGYSLLSLKALSEEFGGVNDQIRDATRGLGDQAEIQQIILKAANDARLSYSDMASSVSKLAQNRDVFDGVEDAAKFATLMAKEFAASGKDSEKVNALMRQITTSISKGKVDSGAMMLLFRESPGTLRMMADSLGVTTDALQTMVSKGKVSADTLKRVFYANSDAIEARFGEVDVTVTDALRNIRNQWGQWVAEVDNTTGASKAVAKGMMFLSRSVMSFLRKSQKGFKLLSDYVGGTKNAVKLLAIVAGSLFVAFNSQKILGFLSLMTSGLKGVNVQLLLAQLKILAIAAVFVIAALIIEDFIGFLQGKNSLIGKIFEKLGIDGEAVRKTILEILSVLYSLFKTLAPVIGFVASLIGKVLGAAFSGIIPIVKGFMTYLSGLIMFITGIFTGDWKKAWEGITKIFSGVGDMLSAIADTIIGVIKPIADAVGFVNGKVKDFVTGKKSDAKPDASGKPVPKLAGGASRTPDTFIAGEEGPELIAGAKGRKVFTASQTGGILRGLVDLASMAIAPRPETIAASSLSVENKTIIQNNEFTNQFYGDRAGQQKSAEAMDKATGDATDLLARGLAYAR